jgi:hypothetical protein
MRGEIMNASKFGKWRAGLRRALKRVAPRNGFFDTIFYSYDDWREFQSEKAVEPEIKENRNSGSEARI